jgi:divalent metal cation (Fe/Co/Zn/Cd) transporter
LPLPLIERSSEEISKVVRKKVESIGGVRGCDQPSVRTTGKRCEISLNVWLDSNLKFEDSHRIALNIEREVKNIIPNARVTINSQPIKSGHENVWMIVKETAEGVPGSRGVHNIHVQRINGKLFVDLHLEVSANLTIKQAHDIAEEVEKRIKASNLGFEDITIHMESASDRISKEMTGVDAELEYYLEHVVKRFPEVKKIHDIEIRRIGSNLHLVLHCHFDPSISLEKAHEISNKIEKAVRSEYPNITRIDIHEEPD